MKEIAAWRVNRVTCGERVACDPRREARSVPPPPHWRPRLGGAACSSVPHTDYELVCSSAVVYCFQCFETDVSFIESGLVLKPLNYFSVGSAILQ